MTGPGLCILNKDCAEFRDQRHFLRSATELPQREMRYIKCLCCSLCIPLTGLLLNQPWYLVAFLDYPKPIHLCAWTSRVHLGRALGHNWRKQAHCVEGLLSPGSCEGTEFPQKILLPFRQLHSPACMFQFFLKNLAGRKWWGARQFYFFCQELGNTILNLSACGLRVLGYQLWGTHWVSLPATFLL